VRGFATGIETPIPAVVPSEKFVFVFGSGTTPEQPLPPVFVLFFKFETNGGTGKRPTTGV